MKRCQSFTDRTSQRRLLVRNRPAVKPRNTGNVVNLMDALRKSLSDAGKRGASQPGKGRKPKKAASGQREMPMAICGKGDGKAKPAAKETKRPTRQRKAG
jgi:DNA end-binding protein Ku